MTHTATGEGAHSALMDGVYRHQRHIYDLTRKYYLLGRDRLIAELQPGPGETVLEVGCGTARNLIRTARRYPEALLFGFDISAEMLATARANVARAGLADRITLAQGDASQFHDAGLFGGRRFDRVFCSYTLSMIPPWPEAIAQALAATTPAGTFHVVDFGRLEGLPRWFRAVLTRWLALFHVAARRDLAEVLAEKVAAVPGRALTFGPLYRGYAALARVD